jgi:hypothetical protein
MSSGNFKCRAPGDVLTIGLTVGEATVKDSDPAVAQRAQRLVMSLTTRTQ